MLLRDVTARLARLLDEQLAPKRYWSAGSRLVPAVVLLRDVAAVEWLQRDWRGSEQVVANRY